VLVSDGARPPADVPGSEVSLGDLLERRLLQLRAYATIGRAIRLALINVGGAKLQTVDRATERVAESVDGSLYAAAASSTTAGTSANSRAME
jgi:hypothetical protein